MITTASSPSPSGILVYVAGPIDSPTQRMGVLDAVDFSSPYESFAPFPDWRSWATHLLTKSGFCTFDPSRGFSAPHPPRAPSIVRRIILLNEEALRTSDVVLADAHPYSVGTQREIALALALGKRVVACQYSLPDGSPHPSPYMHDHRITWFPTIRGAVTYLTGSLLTDNEE